MDAKNEEEAEHKIFAGKKYTLYEAKQRQRQMETAMRAQREKVQLLQHGGADLQEVMLMKAKYQGQLNEYAKFSKKMKLEQERERIYLDMRGRIATNSKQQNSMFPPEMIQNASSDIAQYKKYKEILGDSIGSLVKFGQLKYNDSEKWEKVQSKFFTYLEIDKKDWSQEFKIKSKQAYDRFREQGEELSVHALSRLPRLNKPGYEVIHEKDVLELVKTKPNYSEGEEKIIWFSPSKQLVVIKNKNSGDIVSIIRRKNKKEGWTEQVFRKYMNYIKDFLENTPEDIYEFSIILEDALVDEYDAMYAEQPRATEILAEETPDICASAEPGMKPKEIEEFKRKLEIEYNKALKAVV